MGIFQGEHEGQRGKRPDPLDLAQELGFRVVLFGDGFQLSVVFADTLCERADRFEDRPEGRPECLGDVLGRFVVEASGRALGQAMTEGFDRSLGTWFTS